MLNIYMISIMICPMSKKNSYKKKLLDILQRKRASSTEDLIEEAVMAFPAKKQSTSLRYRFQRTLKQLQENNLVEIRDTERSRFARLTQSGQHSLRTMSLGDNQSLTPMRWDGYWRIVIMNIPENRKDERDAFRYLLKKANFACIKNSVWVSPYPLEHLLENLKKDFGFTDEIFIVLSNKVDPLSEEIFIQSIRD